jgi:dihydroxy-acid dehydratase
MSERKSRRLTVQGGDPLMGVVRTSIMGGTGFDTQRLGKKPLIAVANSHSELTTGHSHLHALGQKVKDGIHAAGGMAVEFNVPAPCDGVAMGHEGMRYVLAQRDLIADIVETHVRSQLFDGIVVIASCDKINPGMLMAAARLDLPAIYLSGGPGMWDIRNKKRRGTLKSVDHKDYEDPSDKVATTSCASCGACELMGTANTIQCLAEVMGMCLPGSANTPGFHPDKLRYARATGERIIGLVEEGITARQIMTREALLNAVIMDLAIGGSTNTTLHLPAIAQSLGLELPLSIFNEYNEKIPTLLAISPNGPHGVVDLWASGGIGAAMKVMKNDLNLECLSVTGKTIGKVIDEYYQVRDSEVVPPRDKPFREQGGTVVLYGNLAPEGAIVKASAVKPDMLQVTGPAICVDSEDEAREALNQGRIKEGSVIVIRYEGPKGGPGMPEMLSITMMLEVMGLKRTALVTDGRFSGATAGPCVGHVSPEAYEGGPIAALLDGDIISIDVPARRIEVKLDAEQIAERLKRVRRVEKPALGYMRRYRKYVSSAARGAVLE